MLCLAVGVAREYGEQLCETPSATTRKVRRKGSAEMTVFTAPLCTIYSGTHSSQSSSSGIIGKAVIRCRETQVVRWQSRRCLYLVFEDVACTSIGLGSGSQSLECMKMKGVPPEVKRASCVKDRVPRR